MRTLLKCDVPSRWWNASFVLLWLWNPWTDTLLLLPLLCWWVLKISIFVGKICIAHVLDEYKQNNNGEYVCSCCCEHKLQPVSLITGLSRRIYFVFQSPKAMLWSRDHGLETRMHSSSFCPRDRMAKVSVSVSRPEGQGLGQGLETWWPRFRSICSSRDLKKVILQHW